MATQRAASKPVAANKAHQDRRPAPPPGMEIDPATRPPEVEDGEWISPEAGKSLSGVLESAFLFTSKQKSVRTPAYRIRRKDGTLALISERTRLKVLREYTAGTVVWIFFDELVSLEGGNTAWNIEVARDPKKLGTGQRMVEFLRAAKASRSTETFDTEGEDVPF